MAVDHYDESTFVCKLLELCLAIQMLIEVKEIPPFIELNKGAGDWHALSRSSLDVPTLRF
jgi:hypothetical protein